MENKQTSYTAKEKKEIQERYKTETPVSITRKLDPYYEAIGEMVCGLVNEDLKPYLREISRRTDIEALVFTNAVLPLLNKAESKEVYDSLQKDYFLASMSAFDILLKKLQNISILNLNPQLKSQMKMTAKKHTLEK